jgi:hypothetical protein
MASGEDAEGGDLWAPFTVEQAFHVESYQSACELTLLASEDDHRGQLT